MIIVGLEGCLSDSRTRGLCCPDIMHEWHNDLINDPLNNNVISIIGDKPYIIITTKPVCHKVDVILWIRKNNIRKPVAIFMKQQGWFYTPTSTKELLIIEAKEFLNCKYSDFDYAIDSRNEVCGMYNRIGIQAFKINLPNTPQTRLL